MECVLGETLYVAKKHICFYFLQKYDFIMNEEKKPKISINTLLGTINQDLGEMFPKKLGGGGDQ